MSTSAAPYEMIRPPTFLKDFLETCPRRLQREQLNTVARWAPGARWLLALPALPLFGLRKGQSLKDIVDAVGGEEVCALLRIPLAIGMAKRLAPKGFPMQRFWAASVRRAIAGALLAGQMGKVSRGQAFLWGLCRDFGGLALAAEGKARGEIYAVVLNTPRSRRRDHERALFGVCGEDMLADLAEAWCLGALSDKADRADLGAWSDALADVHYTSGHPEALSVAEAARGEMKDLPRLDLDQLAMEVEQVFPAVMEALGLPKSGRPAGFESWFGGDRTPLQLEELGSLQLALNTVSRERDELLEVLQRITGGRGAVAAPDPLTGVPTLGTLRIALQAQLKAAIGSGAPVSLLAFSVDKMSEHNLAHGYAHGDVVLAEVAQRVASILRPSDLLGRLGGDTFVVVLPETPLDGARVAALRIRRTMHHHPVVLDSGTVRVTVRVGLAGWSGGRTLSADELIAQGEKALASGRLEGGDVTVEAGARSKASGSAGNRPA